jgi:hypothetical protein
LVLLSRDSSKNAAMPLSTNPVDKFVDFCWTQGAVRLEGSRKLVPIKISAVFSDKETATYEIESASMKRGGARLCQSSAAVH